MVFKIAKKSDSVASSEVINNKEGYRKIQELVPGIVPNKHEFVENDEFVALILSELHNPVAKEKHTSEYFKSLFQNFYDYCVTSVEKKDVTPIDVYKLVRKELERIIGNSVGFPEHVPRITKSRSAIMILDFTPDNLFVDDHRLKFLDPWNQDTFAGSPVVSLAQYITLSAIYKLGSEKEALEIFFKEFAPKFCELLNISIAELKEDFMLGRALQILLSSHFRKSSQPEFVKLITSQIDSDCQTVVGI